MKGKIIFILIFLSFVANSQNEFFNRGALVVIQDSCLVKVQGNVKNTSGTIENNGVFDIDRNHEILNTGVSFGNGEYRVKQDWINDNLFNADSSLVRMWGSNQDITGAVVTSFWNLSNENTGIKTLGLDVNILNTLDLTTVETYVDNYKLTVFNPFVNSVLYDSTYSFEGFVSNSLGGELVRFTNSNSWYILPLGSSIGTQRFRRVKILPSSSSLNSYNTGFYNYDPELDNLYRNNKESNVELINPFFFHKAYLSSGVGNSSLSIDYLVSDGDYSSIAYYNPLWKLTASTGSASLTYNTLSSINLSLIYNDRNYALNKVDLEVLVKQLITPNNDLKNDLWHITNIEKFQNKVTVFNRWGNIVYEMENYTNADGWNGKANRGTNTVTGSDYLPSGTYYYIVELIGLKTLTGYLQLHKN